jgi:hypothetical protein
MSNILSFEFQKKREKEDIWRANDWKLPKLGERDKFTDSRRLAKPKQDKLKTEPRHIIVALLKNTNKDNEYWKEPENNRLHIGKQFEPNKISLLRPWKSEDSGTTYLKCWQKKYCQSSIPYSVKISLRKEGKAKRICYQQTCQKKC